MIGGDEPPVSAGVVSRGLAFALDGLIVTVAVLGGALFVWGLAQVLSFRNLFGGGGGHEAGRTLAFLVCIPIVFALYCTVMWALLGKTIGMALFGVKVVRMDGSPVGLGQSLVRAVCYGLSAILMIGFAWMIFDRRHQGFHDKLARTLVVYDGAAFPVLDALRTTGQPATR
jgi:uncharacterized RDD family membrane protein YckC